MKGIKNSGSPRGEVGEIDTRAPFQSVKAAVSLFGEVALPRERRAVKRRSSENILEKETQLLLAQRELNKLKKQLDIAETTKAKALSELEKAKETLQDLTTKLKNVRESKESAMEAAEAVKNQTSQLERTVSQKAIGFEAWKRELDHARREYVATITELDTSKQELTKIRQDFDAALEAKLAAFQTSGEAQRSAKLNSERVGELSKEIETMRASIEQLKLAPVQAQEEQAKVIGEREAQLSFYKTAKEEALQKLEALKNEYDPELIRSLEAKLTEASEDIEALQEEMKKAHASEMDSVRHITSELKEASKTLQEIAAEETSLKNLVYSLRIELKQVKKEQDELKEKEQAAEALVATLTAELQDSKREAPEPGSEEEKEAHLFYDQSLKIQKLSSETEDAKREAEETRRKAQELKEEAEKSRAVAEETEKKLELILKQAKEAKAAEKRAIEEMMMLSEMPGKDSNSEFSGKIKLPIEEYESLSRKAKECEDLVEKKEAEGIAEIEAIYSRKNEVDRKVEANLKAVEEIKIATEMALWNAETADSVKTRVADELRKWRQQAQKVAADASSQILDYTDNSSRSIPLSI